MTAFQLILADRVLTALLAVVTLLTAVAVALLIAASPLAQAVLLLAFAVVGVVALLSGCCQMFLLAAPAIRRFREWAEGLDPATDATPHLILAWDALTDALWHLWHSVTITASKTTNRTHAALVSSWPTTRLVLGWFAAVVATAAVVGVAYVLLTVPGLLIAAVLLSLTALAVVHARRIAEVAPAVLSWEPSWLARRKPASTPTFDLAAVLADPEVVDVWSPLTDDATLDAICGADAIDTATDSTDLPSLLSSLSDDDARELGRLIRRRMRDERRPIRIVRLPHPTPRPRRYSVDACRTRRAELEIARMVAAQAI